MQNDFVFRLLCNFFGDYAVPKIISIYEQNWKIIIIYVYNFLITVWQISLHAFAMFVTPLEITPSRTLWVIDKTEIFKKPYKYIYVYMI